MRILSRRQALALGAGTAIFTLSGRLDDAFAAPLEVEAEIKKFTGGKAAEQGKVAIDLPEIAENGNTVPLSIVVDSPMEPNNYVSDILVLADGNPRPGVAAFRLTPMAGRAEAATRIRLSATQNIIVVAKTSEGKFFTAEKQVKVTIGGCGG